MKSTQKWRKRETKKKNVNLFTQSNEFTISASPFNRIWLNEIIYKQYSISSFCHYHKCRYHRYLCDQFVSKHVAFRSSFSRFRFFFFFDVVANRWNWLKQMILDVQFMINYTLCVNRLISLHDSRNWFSSVCSICKIEFFNANRLLDACVLCARANCSFCIIYLCVKKRCPKNHSLTFIHLMCHLFNRKRCPIQLIHSREKKRKINDEEFQSRKMFQFLSHRHLVNECFSTCGRRSQLFLLWFSINKIIWTLTSFDWLACHES